ncbi:hypothetical protein P5V15_004202 [Pogonomyrmex californicus]
MWTLAAPARLDKKGGQDEDKNKLRDIRTHGYVSRRNFFLSGGPAPADGPRRRREHSIASGATRCVCLCYVCNGFG